MQHALAILLWFSAISAGPKWDGSGLPDPADVDGDEPDRQGAGGPTGESQ